MVVVAGGGGLGMGVSLATLTVVVVTLVGALLGAGKVQIYIVDIHRCKISTQNTYYLMGYC